MGRRQQLQTILEGMAPNVYFQPPAGYKIDYPCIVYKRYEADSMFANDQPYLIVMGYQVTVIDADPDSEIPDKVAKLPRCTFQRHFTADNLNHDIYNLYY